MAGAHYPDDGELYLELDNVRVSGWQKIRVTRGIERCPSDFDISLTEKFPGSATEIIPAPGKVCRVRIGKDLVLTGYVDMYAPSITPDDHTVQIQGRSACEDIIDCSVIWRGGAINSTNLRDAAQKLCAPYGVKVTSLAGDGPVIPLLMLNLGETPYEVIERIARYAAMLVYDDVQGNLVLSTVGKEKMASGFKQGLNVLAASLAYRIDQRYSHYHAYINSVDSLADIGAVFSHDGNEVIPPVLDQGMLQFKRTDGQPRQRHHSIITEQPDSAAEKGLFVTRRAKWEMARRYGRSQAVRVEADSWRDSAGKLWEPNYRVMVDIPACKLSSVEMVIGDVSYIRDDRGTRAELILMPPEAFEPEPAILNPFAVKLDFTPAVTRDSRRDQG